MPHRLRTAALSALLAVSMAAVGCSSFKAYRIESLPPEYAAKASPAYVRHWMEAYKSGDQRLHFANIKVDKNQTTAELRQGFGDALLARCTVELIEAPDGGKHVEVSLTSANGGYLTLDADAEEIKRQLHAFLMGGR